MGQLVNSIDAEGNVVTTTYDSLYRTLSTISAEGVVVTSTYDAHGRVVGQPAVVLPFPQQGQGKLQQRQIVQSFRKRGSRHLG